MMAEYQESTSITFEWNLKGLRNLFDSSRGEAKSRVTRSVKFGGGKWQILFYANSGEGNFVSLYLNCEPTQEEKDNAVNGKWVREGLFKFSFELRNASKNILFNMKEACDHTFSSRTQNWGWAQFAKRDAVYYSSSLVRQADCFTIICTITSSPIVPSSPSRVKKRPVPTALLDVMGGMLDDPTYSDVEFIFPRRKVDSRRREASRIWACKKLLCRVDYFESMFHSGFFETSGDPLSPSARHSSSEMEEFHTLDDSDLEEEAAEAETLDVEEGDDPLASSEEFGSPLEERRNSSYYTTRSADITSSRKKSRSENESGPNSNTFVDGDSETVVSDAAGTSTPRDRMVDESAANTNPDSEGRVRSPETVVVVDQVRKKADWPGPPKTRVVIKDVAYTTYRAVLYYLYTDSIIFAPLASSFLRKSKSHNRSQSQRVTADMPSDNPREGEESTMSSIRPAVSRRVTQFNMNIGSGNESMNIGASMGGNANLNERNNPNASVSGVQSGNLTIPTTRAQWIKNWGYENPGRPLPCSAKAVYRLADKLDLPDLKERAKEHIIKSLTTNNVPHEVFSSFSAAFEEIRKVQIEFFLLNWGEIRGSEAMSDVWAQIRNGRHPGFEDVWPLVAMNLEYRGTQGEGTVGDGRDGIGE